MTKDKSKNEIEFKTLWAILCKTASVDQHTNQLSLFNIIEDFTVSQSPKPVTALSKLIDFPQKTQIKFDYTLVVLFERNTTEGSPEFNPYLEIRVVDPNGEEIMKNEMPIQFEEGKNRVRTIIMLDSFLATKSGKYDYIISTRNSPLKPLEEKTRTSALIKIYE